MRVMRTCDVRADDPELPAEVRGLCWTYRPHSHKTEHHDKSRLILLGPHAQAIIDPWLRPDDPEAYLFNPAEARNWWKRKRRSQATQPRATDLADDSLPGDHYTIYSYALAVRRACERAFGMPDELRRIRKTTPGGDPIPEAIRADLKTPGHGMAGCQLLAPTPAPAHGSNENPRGLRNRGRADHSGAWFGSYDRALRTGRLDQSSPGYGPDRIDETEPTITMAHVPCSIGARL